MSTIQELLRELCSDDVPSKPLGECCTIAKGVQLNREGLLEGGPYPVINGGIEASGYWTENNFPANRITVSQGGASAGFVNFMNVPFWAGAHCFVLEKPVSGCSYRYLWHCLKQNQTVLMQRKEGAGIPGLGKSTLASIPIPLPPLPVQEEIVRRLDAMQDVVEALENELALRRKQYEAVRERLIGGAAAGAECKTLGEISHYSKERCDATSITREQYVCVDSLLQNKAGRTLAASVPQSGGLVAFRSGDILIGNIRPYLRKIWFSDCDGGTNGDVLVIVANNRKEIEPRFLFHALLSERFFIHSVSGMKEGKMPRGDKATIMKYSIPVPPLPVQEDIAKKLDAFDELVNVALPAEIAARRRAMEAVRERCFAALEKAG